MESYYTYELGEGPNHSVFLSVPTFSHASYPVKRLPRNIISVRIFSLCGCILTDVSTRHSIAMASIRSPVSKCAKRLKFQWQHRCLSASAHRHPGDVRIVEVGPRDGLQNEKTTMSLESKLALIQRLAQTGVQTIEVGSFVAPKWVPQV